MHSRERFSSYGFCLIHIEIKRIVVSVAPFTNTVLASSNQQALQPGHTLTGRWKDRNILTHLQQTQNMIDTAHWMAANTAFGHRVHVVSATGASSMDSHGRKNRAFAASQTSFKTSTPAWR